MPLPSSSALITLNLFQVLFATVSLSGQLQQLPMIQVISRFGHKYCQPLLQYQGFCHTSNCPHWSLSPLLEEMTRLSIFLLSCKKKQNSSFEIRLSCSKSGIIHQTQVQWVFPLPFRASQAYKPLCFARVMGTILVEGNFTLTGWPMCAFHRGWSFPLFGTETLYGALNTLTLKSNLEPL